MPALSTGFIQELVADFIADHPLAQISIHARSTLKLVDWLVTGHLDVALTSNPVVHPELTRVPLARRAFVCLLPLDHPVAGRSVIRASDLAGEPFISLSPDSQLRQRIDRLFEEAGIERRLMLEAPMAPTICALIARGLGVSILNPFYIGAFRDLVVTRPFAPVVETEISVLMAGHRQRSLAAKAFLDRAQAYVGHARSQVVVATAGWRAVAMAGRRRSDRALRGKLRSPGRPGVARREHRCRFWAFIAAGLSSEDAAMEVGVSQPVGFRWFRKAGGMPPSHLSRSSKPLSGRYLSFAEREEIALLRAQGHGVREMARRLGRAPSTISRELRRNAATRGGGLEYRATTAQWHAERAARRPKAAKLATNAALRAYVQERLAGHVAAPGGAAVPGPAVPWKGRRHGPRQNRRWGMAWSPQQIVERLRLDHPDDATMRISHEAIYQALFVQGRGALRRELTACLRTGRALRVPRARTRGQGKSFVTPEVMISQRPAEAEDRAVPGHWEGDLILGLRSSAIGTLVERTTRFTMLLHLPPMKGHGDGAREKNGPALAGHGAEAVRDAITRTIITLPEQLRQSLTWDQGAEMAQHARLRIDTSLQVYFCDPHSPWQRGTNENTNGLLRQYFPKGTDLSPYGTDDLAAVAAALNSRPRKTLGWKTPAEALDAVLRSVQAGVATTC
jgi:IS30 family transposase